MIFKDFIIIVRMQPQKMWTLDDCQNSNGSNGSEDFFIRYIWYNMYLYVGVTSFLWWKKHYNFSQLKQVIAYDHLILIINEPFLFRVSKIYFHAWYRKRNCLSPIQGHPRRLHFIITVENQVFNCNDAMGWLFWHHLPSST